MTKAIATIVLTNELVSIFDDVDNSSTRFAERLLALGIGDRATAKPYAELWAVKRYGSMKRGSAAERAMYRVLRRCFPSDEMPVTKSRKAAPAKFTRDQRSAANLFLQEFEGKTKAEKIRKARALLQLLAE